MVTGLDKGNTYILIIVIEYIYITKSAKLVHSVVMTINEGPNMYEVLSLYALTPL